MESQEEEPEEKKTDPTTPTKDPTNESTSEPKTKTIELREEDDYVLTEMIMASQRLNIWSMLMPAIYQLVPGSMIAKMWFNSIFPPPNVYQTTFNNVTGTVTVESDTQNDIFSNLMVISTSLALGTILGGFVVKTFVSVLEVIRDVFVKCCGCQKKKQDAERVREQKIQKLPGDMAGKVQALGEYDKHIRDCEREEESELFVSSIMGISDDDPPPNRSTNADGSAFPAGLRHRHTGPPTMIRVKGNLVQVDYQEEQDDQEEQDAETVLEEKEEY